MGIIGNLLRRSWKRKRGNRLGRGTLISLTRQLDGMNGHKQRILKLLSFTRSMAQNGVKLVKVFLVDQRTESRTDSIHTFKKTTTFWLRMRERLIRIKCHHNNLILSKRECFRKVFVPTLFMFLMLWKRKTVKVMNLHYRKINKTMMFSILIGWRKIILNGIIGWGRKLMRNGTGRGRCRILMSRIRLLILVIKGMKICFILRRIE